MRRFRRRNRGKWFPWVDVTSSVTVAHTAGLRGNALDSFSPFGIADITSTAWSGGNSPLAAAVGPGSSFLIKRIVGEVHIDMVQNQAHDSHCYVGLGIVVDRTDGAGGFNNLPAWQQLSIAGGAIAPVAQAAKMKRWLFCRSWHFGNSASTVAGRDLVFPPYGNSWGGGGLHTSPHIDVRVKARVSPQERLYLILNVVSGSIGVADGTNVEVTFETALRCFATPTMYDNR